jgi:hypothetical protein
MRIAAVLALAGLAASGGVAARSASPLTMPAVPCGDVIHHTDFPYVGDQGVEPRYRLVLGAVSVPPRYLRQVIPTRSHPWAYWHKSGLVVRAGAEPITVSVPRRWRTRAAISWGNSVGVVHSLRIDTCGSEPTVGNAYAGGFYLRAHSVCLPLTFRMGKRVKTVYFDIGRRCSANGRTPAFAESRGG